MTALIRQIDALLDLDARGALVPHGIGGLARELLTKSRAALASPTPGGVVKQPITDEMVETAACEMYARHYDRQYRAERWAGLREEDWQTEDGPSYFGKATHREMARSALEAASSPAPGEPVAWQVPVRIEDGSRKRRQNLYTERLPFYPGEGVEQLGEPIPLYASPPTSPPEPVQGVLDGVLACLRHTHDRLSEYPEFETLQLTINAEVRNIKAAIANAERSPLPLGDA